MKQPTGIEEGAGVQVRLIAQYQGDQWIGALITEVMGNSFLVKSLGAPFDAEGHEYLWLRKDDYGRCWR